MTRDEEDQVLDALRFDWDEVYEIGAGVDGFWARRRDGTGETMTGEDPGELRRQIREDYSARPRQALPGRPASPGCCSWVIALPPSKAMLTGLE